MYYVYVLKNEEGRLYYGLTNDLRRRLHEHRSGYAKSTRGHKWRIIYYEAYADVRDAMWREKRLKLVGQALAQLKRRLHYSLSKS